MQQIKVYVAAKKKHAAMLLRKMRGFEGIHVCSRWLETAELEINRGKPAPHWQQENFDDIVSAHFVVLYAEQGDHLVIAIGEVFYAMAWNKPIYVIGQHSDNVDGSGAPGTVYHPDYADWAANPNRVRRVPSLDAAVTDMRARVAAEGARSGRLAP